MKIEKISENQIKCILNRDDLNDRQLRISELAYGTEKAKDLFRDMMQQASYQFGFEADDIPLMIEAIPVSQECLVLVITKVDDPDELDTRFSKFSPDSDAYTYDDQDNGSESFADEILNCFGRLNEIIDSAKTPEAASDSSDSFIPLPEAIGHEPAKKAEKKQKEQAVSIAPNMTKVYSFAALDQVASMAAVIAPIYQGQNTLYRSPEIYYLTLDKSDHSPEEFNKVCNIISEYGKTERTTYASSSYYKEHYETIVSGNAIQVLCTL